MSKPSISILTATTRPPGLMMLDQRLKAQTFQDWEWIICAPDYAASMLRIASSKVKVLTDPPKQPGDFYCLNKAWNKMAAAAKGYLLVFYCDWIWIEPGMLEALWNTYIDNPLACVSGYGHHYRKVVDGKPEVWWTNDGRAEYLDGSGRLDPSQFELAVGSIPRLKLLEVGGFDPEYDRAAGFSEKEVALRLAKAGCEFLVAESMPIRTWTHPKESTTGQWDEAAAKAAAMFREHRKQIANGSRLTLATEGEINEAGEPHDDSRQSGAAAAEIA